jgi:hypothetical protein
MKTPFLRLGSWARLFLLPASNNTRPSPATFVHPQAIHDAPALIAALTICGVLGGISLLVPPYIETDTAHSLLAWRGTLLGSVNSMIRANPANIAQDAVEFLAAFSPGTYLIPGTISLLGVPIGIAITLTVFLSILACLIGWIMVIRVFAPQTRLALLVTVLIGSFRYSTSEFGIYHGSEVLLQGATPWLILTAYRIPNLNIASAASLAAGAASLAFLAKPSGLIYVGAALFACSLVALASGRRITYGMIGGALGTLAVLGVLYFAYLSRAWTAVSETSWGLPFRSIAFASLVPWVAGMSWLDLTGSNWRMHKADLAVIIPPAVLVIALVSCWRPQTINEQKFKWFSLGFYGVICLVFIVLFMHGAVIYMEERHFRPAGTVLFVCALMSALSAGTPGWMRGSFLVLCAVTALYGLASFSHCAWTTADGRWLDRKSWTNQQMFDARAIDFAREAYTQEGRDALFVLPAAQLAVTLPIEARIIVMGLNWRSVSKVASDRYSGRVPGHVFMFLPNTILDSGNGMLDMSKAGPLLSMFTDYAPDHWERKIFANMSVFFQ